jgi:hypothetical protein
MQLMKFPDMRFPAFEFLEEASDDWLRAKRLKDKGDPESLKKLKEMENTNLVPMANEKATQVI